MNLHFIIFSFVIIKLNYPSNNLILFTSKKLGFKPYFSSSYPNIAELLMPALPHSFMRMYLGFIFITDVKV